MTRRAQHGQHGTLRLLLDNPEYLALSGAGLLSVVGDQVSRVALSVLVYGRTGSPLLTALVYAVTYLPAVLGGPLLCGLADRFPRKRVMVSVDLVRAVLLASMAVPGMPLGVLLALLLVSAALEAPFTAARSALMRNVLDGDDDRYRAGVGIDQTLQQTAQVLGFAGGGLLLVAVSPTSALLLDAGTFVASAVLLLALVKSRPSALSAAAGAHDVPSLDDSRRPSWLRTVGCDARAGFRAATATAALRRPVLLTWAGVAVLIVPEAVAAPWSHALGAGNAGTGLLLAAGPAGTVVGLVLVTRFVRGRGDAWLAPLALLAMLPLVACGFSSSMPVVLVLVALSGAAGAYVTLAQIVFVSSVDDASRGRALGFAATGVTVAQGLGIAAGGALTELLAPATTVAVAGLAGLGAIALVTVRTRQPQPEPAPVQPKPAPVQPKPAPVPGGRPLVVVLPVQPTGDHPVGAPALVAAGDRR